MSLAGEWHLRAENKARCNNNELSLLRKLEERYIELISLYCLYSHSGLVLSIAGLLKPRNFSPLHHSSPKVPKQSIFNHTLLP